MLRPSLEEFESLARRGNLIPVVREILADLDTPLSLFRRLDDGRTSFLLESVQGGEKWARYSFIGTGARAMFRARGRDIEWSEGDHSEALRVEGDPLEFLRDKLAGLEQVTPEGLELPRFIGGAVGMVGYDWVRFVERLPEPNPSKLDLPDLWFVFPETVVVYDNVRHTALIVRHVHLREGDDPAARYAEAGKDIAGTIRQLRAPAVLDAERPAVEVPMDVQRSVTRESFYEIVKRAKEYIEAGDVFQVVLSQQFEMPLQVEAFEIYRHLRCINPSPYLYFVRMEGAVLVGSSPEILVRLEDGQVDVRPIAGTRRRGRSPEEDIAMEEELLADPKERSEHVMLVDLGRNDAGRVCEIGSVQVDEYALIERYSHVMHIVSNVQGRLRPGLDWLDVLRATFPAGTLSGAPKVRAMEIIDELENVGRGPYGGCIGYIDYSGNMDMAITIRTLVVKDGRIVLQSGAGVVADSLPELEFKETVNKAQALIAAIDLAREGHD
ncbi:MAG: anthranilate synthase component I [Deltaproteobacteria bacterium]|nr:anthranilate synthase component I [Deltaproteobacteria bacterium]MBW2418218.1 anthranilate synthase component I [Deltaproteobacteria bacterium]